MSGKPPRLPGWQIRVPFARVAVSIEAKEAIRERRKRSGSEAQAKRGYWGHATYHSNYMNFGLHFISMVALYRNSSRPHQLPPPPSAYRRALAANAAFHVMVLTWTVARAALWGRRKLVNN
ncbi:hypothetical protein HPP92_018809 [Vanilla planifolia]|nr:hypothetical protein HPP92_018809 [Vanilla planifolia]